MTWDRLVRLKATLRPISIWPEKLTINRTRARYTAPLADTLKVLEHELRELRAKSIVVEIAIREGDFRLDGFPRASAKAEHPGVILSFESKHGPLRIYFDGFTDWEYNLRAIAMHLEHLRKASMYGVGRTGEQYKGWKAITDTASDFFWPSDAARFIVQAAGWDLNTMYVPVMNEETVCMDGYRLAAKKLHPDTESGDEESFKKLQRAKEKMVARFEELKRGKL